MFTHVQFTHKAGTVPHVCSPKEEEAGELLVQVQPTLCGES